MTTQNHKSQKSTGYKSGFTIYGGMLPVWQHILKTDAGDFAVRFVVSGRPSVSPKNYIANNIVCKVGGMRVFEEATGAWQVITGTAKVACAKITKTMTPTERLAALVKEANRVMPPLAKKVNLADIRDVCIDHNHRHCDLVVRFHLTHCFGQVGIKPEKH